MLGRLKTPSYRLLPARRYMQTWCVHEYGGSDALHLTTAPIPAIRCPTDVLVQVHAASVNPIDVRMRSGYGAKALNVLRKVKGCGEFPLTLGRDFSGVVVKTGKLARRFKCGDQVWGSPHVTTGGTHTQYICAKQDEISLKPDCLSHVEASSLPYVACTVWVGLVSRARLNPTNCTDKRVLVYGGSGGIGTFAIQLAKAWGAHVTTTCSTDATDLVTSLGADHVIDYKSTDAQKELEGLEGFDVILDPFGGDYDKLSTNLLSQCAAAVYVNLVPPLLPNTDRLGLGCGMLSSSQSFLSSFADKALLKGSTSTWAFFSPNPGALDHVARLTQSQQIRPVVEAVFPFSKTPEAFTHLEAGHARGKTVIEMVDLDSYN